MRIRTIKPEFWEHPVMGRQSDATKLLAIGLLNLADDEGFFYADPKAVRNAIRPNDDDSRIATVSLRDLSEIGYISIRQHPTHGPIGKIDSFAAHQVINKPKSSKIKALYESGSNTVSIPDGDRLERKGKEEERNGIPPNPQGGFGLEIEDSKPSDPMPKGWQKMNAKTQGQTRVNFNTPEMLEFGQIVARKESTLWTVSEALALMAVKPHPDEISIVRKYYHAEIDKESDFRRRDMITLLNNWNGEVDRARIFNASNK